VLTTSLAQLAGVVRLLDGHLAANKAQLAALVGSWMPELLAEFGVGPVAAAQLLVSWSHPGRCRSAAAFAMLAGTTPLQASSGRVTRHRLNRGGDRQLNRVYNRHRRWSADGTWEKVLDGLRVGCDVAEGADWEFSVDATVIRAHHHAAGARHEPPKDVPAQRLAPTVLKESVRPGRHTGGAGE